MGASNGDLTAVHTIAKAVLDKVLDGADNFTVITLKMDRLFGQVKVDVNAGGL